MKKIFAFLLMFGLTACASDRITLTLTVTNTPNGLDTFVVNGNTRTWTNVATASPSTLVLIGASIGASSTNLFRQIASYPYSGPLDLAFSSSNVITLRGQQGGALAASISGTWATLSYSTQAVATLNAVRVPATSEPTQSTATNIFSSVATALGTHSTNALAAGTTLVGNLVQTTGNQTINGDKTFSSLFSSGTLYVTGDLFLTNNAPTISVQELLALPDAGKTLIDFVSGFRVWFYNDAVSAQTNVFEIDRTGYGATYARFRTKLRADSIYDTPITNSTIYGSTLALTNIVTGDLSFTRSSNTSLAAGDNADVDLGTKVFVKIKNGPGADYGIVGFVGGRDGRWHQVYNATGFNLTIKHDSGIEPTAANRIYTMTGANLVSTGNCFFEILYDTEDSRYIVKNWQP